MIMSLNRLLFIAVMAILSSPSQGGTIRLGILDDAISAGDPGDMGVTFNLLFKKLRASEELTAAKVFHSRTTFIEAIQDNQLDLVPLESFLYFEFKDQANLNPALTARFDKSPMDQFLLLGRKSLKGRKLQDLASCEVVLDATWFSPYANLWLSQLLDESKLPAPDAYFKSVADAERASKAILPVFFGSKDLCVATRRTFDAMAELNPQINNQLVVLAESRPLLLFILCLAGDRSADNSRSIIDIVSNAHEDPVVNQILTISKVERLLPYEEGQLATIRELWEFQTKKAKPSITASTSEDP